MSEIKKYIPSFGRKHGRTLKIKKQVLLENFLPELLISSDEVQNIKTPIHLEIGFGSGEHLCHRAAMHPEITFIGCEVYEHGIAACAKEIQDKNLANVRLFTDDARLFLDEIPDGSLDKIYILFPDPWPKKKHHKRRIINQEMLGLLYKVLSKNGEIALATDHHEYAHWMMVHLENHKNYQWLAENKNDWRVAPTGHISTRYQQKNKAGTDYPVFLNFRTK